MTAARLGPRVAFFLFLVPSLAAGDKAPPPAPRSWQPVVEVLLRGDAVGRPAAEDLERAKFRLRLGLLWTPDPRVEMGVVAKGLAGSEEVVLSNDNERRDGVELDRAFVRWLPVPSFAATAGKDDLPLALSPLLWDADNRPLGFGLGYRRPLRAYDTLALAAGAWTPDDRFEDDSRLAAAQVAWRIRDGAALGGEVILSGLFFDDLEALAASPLARTNRRLGTLFASDYELLDLRLGLRLPAGAGALELTVEGVENLGAENAERALRGEATFRARPDGGFEAGAIAQRIEADAVLAAFNSDDWWLHSASRGGSAWAGWGFPHDLTLRAAYFSERRDDLERWFDRILLDLTWSLD